MGKLRLEKKEEEQSEPQIGNIITIQDQHPGSHLVILKNNDDTNTLHIFTNVELNRSMERGMLYMDMQLEREKLIANGKKENKEKAPAQTE